MIKKNTSLIVLTLVCFLTAAAFFGLCEGLYGAEVYYEPTWESLAQHSTPKWFEDAVFGIYFHWGIYSATGQGLFYGMGMYRTGTGTYNYHIKNYGDPCTEFGYKDFIPMFKAQKWDPDRWAKLFKNAGADFAGPCAEHHDGFSMWDTQYNKFNAMDMGPHRDIVGEMLKAVRAHGMKTVTTFHHSRNWTHFMYGRRLCPKGVGVNNPEDSDLYGPIHEPEEGLFKNIKTTPGYQEKYTNKIIEVIDKYRPDQIWLEDLFPLFIDTDKYVKPMLAYYFNSAGNWGKEVMVTHKHNDLPMSCSELDHEQGWGEKAAPQPQRWQADVSLPGCGWAYSSGIDMTDEEIDSGANKLVDSIVSRISKNGVTLLSITPKGDGTIPVYQMKMLNKLGDWMDVNKVALYGAHWRIPCEAGTLRFTEKGSYLYAIDLSKPNVGKVIPGVTPVQGSEIRMLGCDKPLTWHQAGADVVIDEIPDPLPCDYAWTFKIQVKGESS